MPSLNLADANEASANRHMTGRSRNGVILAVEISCLLGVVSGWFSLRIVRGEGVIELSEGAEFALLVLLA